MKKIFAFLCMSLFAFNAADARITESDALKKYHEANIAYQKLEYDKSILLYNELISNDYRSAEVYYNLGNAYFKSGSFSKAILNYERAKKFEPEDDDINFNLKIASLKVVDKVETAPQIFYKRWINQMALTFSSDTWTVLFIILVWMLFISAGMYVFSSGVTSKKIAFFSLLLFIATSFSAGFLMLRSHSIMNVEKQAVIMASSVYVKSSPDEKGNDLFILHEGTKADVMEEIGDWRKIKIANGSVGWIRFSELEII